MSLISLFLGEVQFACFELGFLDSVDLLKLAQPFRVAPEATEAIRQEIA